MTDGKEEPKKLTSEQKQALRKEIIRIKRKIEENKKKIVKDKGLIKRELTKDAAKLFFILTFILLYFVSKKLSP